MIKSQYNNYYHYTYTCATNKRHYLNPVFKLTDSTQAQLTVFAQFVVNRKERRINGRVCTYRNERLLSVASVSGPHTRESWRGRASRRGRREPTCGVDRRKGEGRPSSWIIQALIRATKAPWWIAARLRWLSWVLLALSYPLAYRESAETRPQKGAPELCPAHSIADIAT